VLVLESTAEHTFRTAPTVGTTKKTRIWVLGDHGTDPPNTLRQDSVITSFRNYVQQNALEPMDLWLWLGDNAYDGGRDVEYQVSVFDKTRARYDWMFRKTPFFSTPGNHEYYYPGGTSTRTPTNRANHDIDYYKVVDHFKNAEAGGEPSGTERYYSFNYSNIHFVSLDTWGTDTLYGTDAAAQASILALGTKQRNWLRRDLTKAQADPALHWIIVFTHMPPYTAGTHNSDTETDLKAVRQNLVPILDSFRVDLVMTGHSHNYERSRLMREHYSTSNTFDKNIHTPFLGSNAQGSGRYDGSANSCFYYKHSSAPKNEGIIYVVNGAGGRGEYQHNSQWPLPAIMQSASHTGGSMYLEVNGKRLDAKYIGGTGQVIDKFTIIKDVEGFTIPPTDGSPRTATCECTETEGVDRNSFTHYADNLGNLLLSIQKGGKNIGKVGTAPFEVKLLGVAGAININANSPTSYVRPSTYGYRGVGAPWRAFNRYFTLTPGSELTGNSQLAVRQYYNEADLTALNVPYADDPMVHGNLKPFKINNGPTTTHNPDPASGHTTIPQAPAFNAPGAWVYDFRGDGPTTPYPTTHWWKHGTLGNGNYFAEYVVGRLKGGGGIGAPTNFSTNPSGKKEQALGIWNYLVSKTAPPEGWKGYQFFDVSGWGRGYPPLGYSPRREDGELTLITNGCTAPNDTNTNCADKNITTYFRAYLFLDHLEQPFYKSFILNYKRDDGVVIYINGNEVFPRDPNMPQPPRIIYDTTRANGASDELEWRTVVIPNNGSYIQPGFNVIAAEVHQVTPGSSDLHFNLEVVGTPDVATVPSGSRLAASGPVIGAETVSTVFFPNPANENVYFSPPLKYQTFQLLDARGVLLRSVSQPGTLRELDVSALPAGLYLLRSQGDEKAVQFKISKP